MLANILNRSKKEKYSIISTNCSPLKDINTDGKIYLKHLPAV